MYKYYFSFTLSSKVIFCFFFSAKKKRLQIIIRSDFVTKTRKQHGMLSDAHKEKKEFLTRSRRKKVN